MSGEPAHPCLSCSSIILLGKGFAPLCDQVFAQKVLRTGRRAPQEVSVRGAPARWRGRKELVEALSTGDAVRVTVVRDRRWRFTSRTAAVVAGVLLVAASIQPANAALPLAGDITAQQAVDAGVASAADHHINQNVALVDRTTGRLVASRSGDVQVISESIVKLFTVAYYLVQYDGHLPVDMAADLYDMIVHSNDSIESRYWTTAAVPAMATRYHLMSTSNGPKTGPDDWGWEYITANDEANFLYRASVDPVVGPFLMDAMANVAPVGADGFDQHFGFNALTGTHGSKQGWTDRNTSEAINVHSVGWTRQYFGAILETSDSPQYDTMRADSTATARLIAGIEDAPTADPTVASADKVALASVATQLQQLVRRLLVVVGLAR